MLIKIRCACGNVLLAPENRVGQAGQCPSCNRSITVRIPHCHHEGATTYQDENEASLENFLPKDKPSFLLRLLSAFFYLLSILIFVSVITLHVFTKEQIKDSAVSYPWLQEHWEEYKEPIIMVRDVQRSWYYRFQKKLQKKLQTKTKSSP